MKTYLIFSDFEDLPYICPVPDKYLDTVKALSGKVTNFDHISDEDYADFNEYLDSVEAIDLETTVFDKCQFIQIGIAY
jgi:hypothetical protein